MIIKNGGWLGLMLRTFFKMIKYIILSIILLNISPAYAIVLEHNNLKLHINGYLGYKYTTSTAKNTTIQSQPELGLELSLDINDHWSAFTQFTYDKNINNALVYSFLTYEQVITPELSFRINAGKLRHDIALYNNVRINPRTRPGVIVPQAIYWDSLKYIITSGEGINLTVNYKNFEAGYTIDNPIVDDPKEEAAVWTAGLTNKIETSFGSHQAVFAKYTFDEIPLTLKSSWTRIDLGPVQPTSVNIGITPKTNEHTIMQFWSNGFIFNKDGWNVSAEMLIVKPQFLKWFQDNPMGYSFSVSKEISEHVSIYANYNKYESQPLRPTYSWFKTTEDVSVGVNYHHKQWMVGAEVHHVNGGRWLKPSEFFQNPNDYKEWWMVGVNVVYFF